MSLTLGGTNMHSEAEENGTFISFIAKQQMAQAGQVNKTLETWSPQP